MRRSPAALVAVLALAAIAPEASASTPFWPCRGSRQVECARVAVPIDRSGRVPGAIALHVERVRAKGKAEGAVLAFVGGPGGAASPLLEDLALEVEAASPNHDLVLFDQRGTGRSGLLHCPTLERNKIGNLGRAIEGCAASLGPRRSFYGTPDSVEDIEAVRRALGYQKLVLYGTSYGTRVALAYASSYPAQVEKLLLDSLVPLDGSDQFMRDTFRAVPRVLRDLCAARACDGITIDPVADLARLVAGLARAPIRGSVFGGDGRARARRLGRLRLLGILLDGDLDPSLRAELPSAVTSALRGDVAPILRLAHRAAFSDSGGEPPSSFSPAAYVASLCEDGPLPWPPEANFGQRWREALSKARAVPDASFYPFDRATGQASDTLRICAHWPSAPPRPFAGGPLPSVPTLILSGAFDLRTPEEGAVELKAALSSAILLVVPGTGHSVIGTDITSCSSRAVRQFLTGQPITASCPKQGGIVGTLTKLFLRPRPVAPAALRDVRRARGVPGRPGRTLRAVALTLADSFFQELFTGFSPVPIGGLRGGRIRADGSLDRYSYVPGVAVSSTPVRELKRLRLRVRGGAASHGVLRLHAAHGRIEVRGRLGKRRVRGDLRDLVGRRVPPSGAESPPTTSPSPSRVFSEPESVRARSGP